MGGMAPYGLEVDPRRKGYYRISKTEKFIRDSMFALKERGCKALQIANALNEQKEFNRRGARGIITRSPAFLRARLTCALLVAVSE